MQARKYTIVQLWEALKKRQGAVWSRLDIGPTTTVEEIPSKVGQYCARNLLSELQGATKELKAVISYRESLFGSHGIDGRSTAKEIHDTTLVLSRAVDVLDREISVEASDKQRRQPNEHNLGSPLEKESMEEEPIKEESIEEVPHKKANDTPDEVSDKNIIQTTLDKDELLCFLEVISATLVEVHALWESPDLNISIAATGNPLFNFPIDSYPRQNLLTTRSVRRHI